MVSEHPILSGPLQTSPPVKTTPAKPVSTKDTTPPKPQEDEFEDEEDDDDEEEDGEGQTGTVMYNFVGENWQR